MVISLVDGTLFEFNSFFIFYFIYKFYYKLYNKIFHFENKLKESMPCENSVQRVKNNQQRIWQCTNKYILSDREQQELRKEEIYVNFTEELGRGLGFGRKHRDWVGRKRRESLSGRVHSMSKKGRSGLVSYQQVVVETQLYRKFRFKVVSKI